MYKREISETNSFESKVVWEVIKDDITMCNKIRYEIVLYGYVLLISLIMLAIDSIVSRFFKNVYC